MASSAFARNGQGGAEVASGASLTRNTVTQWRRIAGRPATLHTVGADARLQAGVARQGSPMYQVLFITYVLCGIATICVAVWIRVADDPETYFWGFLLWPFL